MIREEILDSDNVYLRVHVNESPKGTIEPGHFKPAKSGSSKDPDGMSVNWSKYSDAEYTRTNSCRQPPEMYGVIVMSVEKIRAIRSEYIELQVIHDPETDNYAHSLVLNLPEKGPIRDDLRLQLKDIASWAIIPDINNIRVV